MTKEYKYIRISEKKARDIAHFLELVASDKRNDFDVRYLANFYSEIINDKVQILTPKTKAAGGKSSSVRLRMKKEAIP